MDVLHVGRNDESGFYYYAMELADDPETGAEIDVDHYEPHTLALDLKSRRQQPIEDCVKIGASLAKALGHLHANGLTHRDVKPSNVIFVKGIPKLADVGLVARSGRRTYVGTEGYVPPEGPGTAAADIYSLAMVLYEMGTGKDRLDFPELPTNLELAPTVNRDEWRKLNTVICRAGAPDPRKRTESGEVLAWQLEQVIATEELPTGNWRKSAALFLALAVAAGVGFGAFRHFADDPEAAPPPIANEINLPPELSDPESGNGSDIIAVSPSENGNGGAEINGQINGSPEISKFLPDPFDPKFSAMIRDGGSISTGFNGGDSGSNGEVKFTDKGTSKSEPDPQLPPEPPVARLKITQPTGAAVWNGEEQIEFTPTGWLEFEPGPVSLVLRKSGYHDYLYERSLDEGGNLEGSIQMKQDRRPVIGEAWENSLAIAFEPIGKRHICAEIPRDLFDRFVEDEKFPFTRVQPVDSGGAAEDAAFADDRSMWAFSEWMTTKDQESGYLGRDQYYVAQRFSSEGETQAFFCVTETRSGLLALNSRPAGAEVYRNDTYLGSTPLSLQEQHIGRHEFTLRLPGHRETPAVIDIIEGDVVPLIVELERDNSVLFGEPWENSLGVRLVPMEDALMVSTWETRVQDYAEFLKSEPEGIEPPRPGFEQAADHPVAGVTAEEAREFCRWLTKKERTESLIHSYHEYRLPTDREWSAMAGLPDEKGATPEIRDVQQVPGHYPWGSEWPPPPETGNFADVTSAKTQGKLIITGYDDKFVKTSPVGSFRPNSLGLFDLAGNVWEWVDDPYGGPKSPLLGVRGGGWDTHSRGNLLTTYRNAIPPALRDGMYGFRFVLVDTRKAAN